MSALDVTDDPYPAPTSSNEEPLPTLAEMRANLGFVGKLIAGTVEVALVTAGSALSGAALGYVGGGIMGVPTLFQASPGVTGVGAKLGAWNARAIGASKNWAQLSGAFSGFHAVARVARDGREDRWNAVVGSAMTGAYLSRGAGAQAMVQGAATYAGFTYFVDKFFASPTSGQERRGQEGEMAFSDVYLED